MIVNALRIKPHISHFNLEQAFDLITLVKAKAKPLFRGHYQPHIPADLGFYDLRLSESREAQAQMAQQYGVEGFCYWHYYWFGNGKRLLERPFMEVLESGKPDFLFA